jgi:hypothetical protein
MFTARHGLALTLMETGRPGEAADIFAENVVIQRRLRGPAHDDTLRSLQSLGRSLSAVGRNLEAELALREVVALRIEHFGPEHASTILARRYLAIVLEGSGRLADAEREYCEIVAAMRQGEPSPARFVAACDALGRVRLELGRQQESLDALREGCAAAGALAPGSPPRLDITLQLARQRLRVGQAVDVPALLEPIEGACVTSGGSAGARARACRNMLIESYDALGRTRDAEALRARMATATKGS